MGQFYLAEREAGQEQGTGKQQRCEQWAHSCRRQQLTEGKIDWACGVVCEQRELDRKPGYATCGVVVVVCVCVCVCV